jgi:hypothetical protein
MHHCLASDKPMRGPLPTRLNLAVWQETKIESIALQMTGICHCYPTHGQIDVRSDSAVGLILRQYDMQVSCYVRQT